METIPDFDGLALIPMGLPSDNLEPTVEMIASWSEPFSQRALLIGVSGCHAILFLGSESGRMSSRIGSLGTDEILKCPWVCAKDQRARHAGTNAGRVKAVEFADSKPSIGLSNRSGELMRKSDQGHALIGDPGDLASRRRSEAAFFRFVTV
jgi:hypothetical protein